MNVLEIIVIVLTFGLAAAGFCRGFVRKLASMLSLVLSIALVSFCLPYVTEFLKTSTPVYSYIVEQCERTAFGTTGGLIGSGSTSGGGTNASGSSTSGSGSDSSTPGSLYSSIGREQIKSLMEQYGYDSSAIDSLSDEELEQYKEQYLSQYLGGNQGNAAGGQTGTAESQGNGGVSGISIDRSTQMEIIDALPVPQLLKDLLIDYNNDEGYESLQVTNFQDYVIEFIATAILNVIAFIAAVILVQILLRIAIAALDILAHIPVISGVNRIAGMALGLVQALFFLWIFFLILSMIQMTDAGLALMNMVEESSLLSWLYESNLFLQIVLRAAALFV